jgi:nucleoside-diphosphate-sugar epimerase
MTKDTILVTGATGFIGQALVNKLSQLKQPYKIICLITGKKNTRRQIEGSSLLGRIGLERIEVDLLGNESNLKIQNSPRVVFHLAGNTNISDKDHSITDIGTQNLFNAIEPIDHRTHFIFSSAINVNDHRDDYEIPVDEHLRIENPPANEYGRKKVSAEEYLIKQAEKYGFRLSIVRICGIYGDGSNPSGFFKTIESLVLSNSPFKALLVKLNWPGKLAVCHVDDLVSIFVKVLDHPPPPGSCEICCPVAENLTTSEISSIIHEAIGKEYKKIRLPNFIWRSIRWLAKKKQIVRLMLPHNMYMKYWQLCVLVNSELWNISSTNKFVSHDWKPRRFKSYYDEKVATDLS